VASAQGRLGGCCGDNRWGHGPAVPRVPSLVELTSPTLNTTPVGCVLTTLTVTAKGQVTLRQELFRHLGVDPGQQIEVTALPGGRIEILAARPAGD
jgi:hypothetical protein